MCFGYSTWWTSAATVRGLENQTVLGILGCVSGCRVPLVRGQLPEDHGRRVVTAFQTARARDCVSVQKLDVAGMQFRSEVDDWQTTNGHGSASVSRPVCG